MYGRTIIVSGPIFWKQSSSHIFIGSYVPSHSSACKSLSLVMHPKLLLNYLDITASSHPLSTRIQQLGPLALFVFTSPMYSSRPSVFFSFIFSYEINIHIFRTFVLFSPIWASLLSLSTLPIVVNGIIGFLIRLWFVLIFDRFVLIMGSSNAVTFVTYKS